jgi:hypothetical protein
MIKILIVLLLLLSVKSFGQFTFKTTTDTVYFFVYNNDSVKLEPLGIPPHATLVSNFDALGYSHYIADKLSTCTNFINNMHLHASQLSASLIIDSKKKHIHLTIIDEFGKETNYNIYKNKLITNIPALNVDKTRYTIKLDVL